MRNKPDHKTSKLYSSSLRRFFTKKNRSAHNVGVQYGRWVLYMLLCEVWKPFYIGPLENLAEKMLKYKCEI